MEKKDKNTEEVVDETVNTEEQTVEEQTTEETPELSLQEQLEQQIQQNSELKDKYLRMYAEFENFRKRTMKEKLEIINLAAKDTMTALLPVLDDFDRAKKNAEANDQAEGFDSGVGLIYQKLYRILNTQGLEPMESIGEPFNPELHEALTEIPAPTEELKGKVVDNIEKGYTLKGKIIRHAKVVVGK